MWWIVAIVAISVGAGLIDSWMKNRRKLEELKIGHLKEELELERLRNENFVLETEKMRLELEAKRLEPPYIKDPILADIEKEKA
ncbi:hypothetical protein ACFO0S_07490 [Chryseomicrobium palamuruense]|uniref:Cell division protein FtsL n=1 Tax=Chryseomicrobium palamuruense TaxID=682973 RepID=A0ABV8UUA1_9BACL